MKNFGGTNHHLILSPTLGHAVRPLSHISFFFPAKCYDSAKQNSHRDNQRSRLPLLVKSLWQDPSGSIPCSLCIWVCLMRYRLCFGYHAITFMDIALCETTSVLLCIYMHRESGSASEVDAIVKLIWSQA